MRLAVNAGAIQEDADQRGLAHFLEHMAFNGTRELQAGRAGVVPRIDRRALRPARQRLDVVRRNHLHARDPDRSAGLRRSRHAGAARFRRRHLAAAGRSRKGTRRRPRRMARPPRRRIAAHRQAAAGDLPGIALCRAPADRPAGNPEERAARDAWSPFYQKWYRPDQHGRGRGRRHPGRRGREAGRSSTSAAIPAAKGALGNVDTSVPAHKETLVNMSTDPEAQGWSVSVAFKHKAERRRDRARLSQVARREPAVADVQPAAARHRAAAERAVPRRASRHQRHRPLARAVRARSGGAGRQDHRGPRRADDRSASACSSTASAPTS